MTSATMGHAAMFETAQSAPRSGGGVAGLLGVVTALAGAACAAYVLVVCLTGREMALGMVFAAMMSTPWGWWLGAPVAAWLLAMFVFVLAALWRSRDRGGARRRLEELAAAEVALGGTALWFMGLFVSGAIHTSMWFFGSLACAILTVHFLMYRTPVAWRGGTSADGRLTRRGFFKGAALGAAAVAVLALGQWWGPLPARAADLARQAYARMHLDSGVGPDRLIWPYDAGAPVRVEGYPLIGRAQATRIVIASLDYSDAESRFMHAQLLRLRETYGEDVAILPLWFPLDAACNPQAVVPTGAGHPDACGYARLSLAVWLAAPQRFEEFHRYLVHAEDPATPVALADAERQAAQWVGPQALQQALANPRIEQLLAMAIAARPPYGGFGDTAQERARNALRPFTMWSGEDRESPGVTIWGTMDFQELARGFERSTGMLPLEDLDSADAALLEKLAK